MLGGENGVFHPRITSDLDPLVHIEPVGRIRGGRLVAAAELIAVKRAHPEVDEHAGSRGIPIGAAHPTRGVCAPGLGSFCSIRAGHFRRKTVGKKFVFRGFLDRARAARRSAQMRSAPLVWKAGDNWVRFERFFVARRRCSYPSWVFWDCGRLPPLVPPTCASGHVCPGLRHESLSPYSGVLRV
jgi:hypothetical protein